MAPPLQTTALDSLDHPGNTRRRERIVRDPILNEVIGCRTVISTDVQRSRDGTMWRMRCQCGLVEWVRAIGVLTGDRDRCAGCVVDAQRAERAARRRDRREKKPKPGAPAAVFSPRRIASLESWMGRQTKPVRVRDVVMHYGWSPADVVSYLGQLVARGRATHTPGGIRDEPTWTPVAIASPDLTPPATVPEAATVT